MVLGSGLVLVGKKGTRVSARLSASGDGTDLPFLLRWVVWGRVESPVLGPVVGGVLCRPRAIQPG